MFASLSLLLFATPAVDAFLTLAPHRPSRSIASASNGRFSHQHQHQHKHVMGTSTTDNNNNIVSMAMVDESMNETYDTLAIRLIERYEKDLASESLKNGQLFVCVAGGPGSGKSTLSAAVAQRINEQMCWKMEDFNSPDDANNNDTDNNEFADDISMNKKEIKEEDLPPHSIVLPMDGFHYPRAELKTMGENPTIPATYEDLLARRGAPWTFDAEKIINAFTYARLNGEASLPVYDRTKSDPVANGVKLHPLTKIVILEGNYLLAWDAQRWEGLKTNEVFDETWYINCESKEGQRERLVKRHLETWSEEKTKMWGEGEEGAGAKADANDVKNAGWIEENSKKHADLVIESL